jgi:cobyric acid synthase CobQ
LSFYLKVLTDKTYLTAVTEAQLKPPKKAKVTAKKKPSLMIQGTASNAGKSILTAAFCRILFQDGLKVAPFKSQNMALNSYVTKDGLEIPRAQVVQAQACRIDPDIRMGPILLKPNADTESQIIINGKAVDNMTWQKYTNYKERAFKEVKKAYDSLSDEYDAIVLEGAGSPAEVNLKQNDIVNLGMARYAQAPVIVAGDIDRGGVYASFVGTMEVLLPWERELIAGFLVNRFRGDASLLGDAHNFVLDHTGRPVIGVVPYIHDLNLPQEDDIIFKVKNEVRDQKCLDIVLLGLPRISNFTDVDAFDIEEDVQLRIIRNANDIGHPDCLIIPGSKSTITDLESLKNNGIADKISQLSAGGSCQIVGICGGFQMMGKRITDPYGVESTQKNIEGLKLLDITTEMATEKTLRQVKLPDHIAGYEIHHGKTSVQNDEPFIIDNGQVLGVRNTQSGAWGTYLHGIFDDDIFRMNFLNKLRSRKNIPLKKSPTIYNLEPAFDRLAETVRNGVDMEQIYQIMGL